jgi:hypothetical protein
VTTRPHLLTDSPKPVDGEVVDELATLREDVAELRKELDELQDSLDRDRQKLGAMLHALRAIFGGEAEAIPQPTGTSNPRWEALKRAFPGRCAELIDTLIAHGPLRTSQIAAIMRSDPRTVTQLIHKLNKAGGIEKNGGKFSLKP